MQPHRVLAATLAVFFVVGCSTEKSTSPKAGASTEPKERPSVEPSREAASAPPPKADPPPMATAPLPAQHEDPAKDTDKPPAPPDPYAGIDAEWRPVYMDFAELLIPIANKGVAVARALWFAPIIDGELGEFSHGK